METHPKGEDSIDFQYSLTFLQNLNRLTVEGKPVADKFCWKGYDLWQSYQQILFQEIKQFSISQSEVRKQKKALVSIKTFLTVLIMSFLAVISASVMVIARRRVLIYEIDNTASRFRSDFRMADVHEALRNRGIKYFEIFHTVLGRKTLINFLTRRRPALYLEFPDWLSFRKVSNQEMSWVENLDYDIFSSQKEKEFAKLLLRQTVRHFRKSCTRILFWSKALPLLGVKKIYLIDDGRFYTDLILAARFSGIKTYAIQHGHFTKYHVGWIQAKHSSGAAIAPNRFIVWSSYWKKELIHLGTFIPENSILVAGSRTPKKIFEKKKTERREETVVLVPYEIDGPKKEIADYINEVLKCKNVRVIFKTRPDRPPEQQLREYNLQENMPRFSVMSDTGKAMEEADIVAGSYSTFLYEALWYDKRVALFDTSIDFGEGMIKNGIADRICPEVCRDIERIKKIPHEVVLERRKKLYGDDPLTLRQALTKFIAEGKI